MMMPSMVKKDRILLPMILFIAILKDCRIFIYVSIKVDLSVMDPHHTPRLHCDGAVMGDHDDGIAFIV